MTNIRKDLSAQAVELFKKRKFITLEWATGVGKSKAAIDCITFLQPHSVLLVVAERAHVDNWQDEFVKWKLPTKLLNRIETICYASLHKYEGQQYDLVIFDEAHHLDTTLRLNSYMNINMDNIIFLSATMKDSLIGDLNACKAIKIERFKYNIKDAMESKVLPKPKIYAIPLELSTASNEIFITRNWGEKNKHVKLECSFNDRFNYMNRSKYPNAALTIKCSQAEAYEYYTKEIGYWKKRYFNTKNIALKNKWLQCCSVRKRFLSECKDKYANTLVQFLFKKNIKFIGFCGSINQATLLPFDDIIHSKKKDPQQTIDKFNNGKLMSLGCVGMLQEGQNLKGIQASVIIQLDGQERAFIQKFGRVLRSTDPIQYILYFKNTRDSEYLEKVKECVDRDYFEEIQLNDIEKYYEDNN